MPDTFTHHQSYKATIKETSRELSPRERVRYKNTSGAIKLDEIIKDDEKFTIKPIGYVILDIHNDNADPEDYENYVIVDADNNTYITGSASFWKQFKGIWDEMAGIEEDWELEIFKLDSKNYKGKKFITCNIV